MFSFSKIARFIALFRAMNHSCIWLDLILIDCFKPHPAGRHLCPLHVLFSTLLTGYVYFYLFIYYHSSLGKQSIILAYLIGMFIFLA